MQVIITSEFRFLRSATGSIWTETVFPYDFWTRYLSVFDHVYVVARVVEAGSTERCVRANGPGVTFIPVPYYVGPAQYLQHWFGVRKTAQQAAQVPAAVILRVPSVIAGHLSSQLASMGKPFGLEVVGDPMESLARGSVRHPLRPIFRLHAAASLRRQCREACAVAYVTKSRLQLQYPCRSSLSAGAAAHVDTDGTVTHGGCLATNYSSVVLRGSDIDRSRWLARSFRVPFRVMTIASLAQLYKGTDVLIAASAACVGAGADLTLTVVGGGRYRSELGQLADAHGIGGRVEFAGELPAGDAVRARLDASDLFVLPSRTEGLPRAMIEAMARGLPCIGSSVGGIPELLTRDDMVPPNDSIALCAKILAVMRDPSRLEMMSRRNVATAMEYRDTVLNERRRRFYEHVRDCTGRWQLRHKGTNALTNWNASENRAMF
jgi:glycosyltransferase involved in cell wall biosynthesis